MTQLIVAEQRCGGASASRWAQRGAAQSKESHSFANPSCDALSATTLRAMHFWHRELCDLWQSGITDLWYIVNARRMNHLTLKPRLDVCVVQMASLHAVIVLMPSAEAKRVGKRQEVDFAILLGFSFGALPI